MMKATLRLFKALPIIDPSRKGVIDSDLMKNTIRYGFIFAPEVLGNYDKGQLTYLVNVIIQELGLSPEQLNNAFHKSWQKIHDAPLIQLFMEQITHYLTTYGFERLGIYSKDSIYIPNEALQIPEFRGMNLTIIKGYTKDQLKDKLFKLLSSGVALQDDTRKDVSDLVIYLGVEPTDIESIKNKEVRIALYDYFHTVPANPIECLRLMIYKATGKTLIIKNKETIQKIKARDNYDIDWIIRSCNERKMASIFLRFKDLFLAFRTNPKMREYTNKLRKLAKVEHKPMPRDYLNDITYHMKHDDVSTDKLHESLNKTNTFRKIRLAYAIHYRNNTGAKSILYKIRNGKGYATKLNRYLSYPSIYRIVIDSIVSDLAKNVKGKSICIPPNLVYALPATEKQFTGMMPSGSFITVPKDIIVGIHWNDLGDERIDLDLSMQNIDTKIGWDASYHNRERTILFSGDMTAAPPPNGATECFYIKSQSPAMYLLQVNKYNLAEEVEVPFTIFVATEHLNDLPKNYMVNPNNMVCVNKSKMGKDRQKILGLLVMQPDGCQFYFSETGIGKGRSARNAKYIQHARQYMIDFYTHPISLNDLLILAGATLTQDKEKCDINLSPEVLEKDTILKLFF